jgi:hypothetical protein
MSAIDPKICPFCAKPNGCQAGDPACWCNTESVPAALRALVPLDKVMKACICRDCVRTFKGDPERFVREMVPS